MKKGNKKAVKDAFKKDYLAIVKDFPANQQWAGRGDAFVKFSLYKETPTIAVPNTTYLG
jgi:hypothetical protein